MDRRSWPWKKKSSEKGVNITDSIDTALLNSIGNQADQDSSKRVSYVQISEESYAHLTELEGQVKVLHEKLNLAHDDLSSAQSEITNKEILVKQHAKVAEEAVSGWEKAEAEALALKNQLESVTLLKLTAEERASHLDGALKECMKQIRNVKEESKQKLEDVIFTKTKQWEKVKVELEAKIVEFEQDHLRASAENAALSRSLQEYSNLLMKISEEKSLADDEIEELKNNVQSCERETSSLKYELNILSKELEIRHEEKNMSIRSSEAENKQHLEDVKKITKLEAECQRLRSLVRKKLPGPAALAQMKVEVENLGRDYVETRLRRSPSRSSITHHPHLPDFALENIQQCLKENEFLTARLLATEEETKMLKEALSKRNSELQASRNTCAKTVNKLHNLEARMIAFNQQQSPSKPNSSIHFEKESTPRSLTSMSEDGTDEIGSYSESCAPTSMSEVSHFKKDKDFDKSNKTDHLELMDDFLEMERLACISIEASGSVTISDGSLDKTKIGSNKDTSLVDVSKEEQLVGLEPATYHVSSSEEKCALELTSDITDAPLLKLQSRINSVFESQSQDRNMENTLEHIKCILQEAEEELSHRSERCILEETRSVATSEQNHCDEAMGEIINSVVSLKHERNSCLDSDIASDQEFKNAFSQIYNFVISLRKEAIELQSSSSDDNGLTKKIEEFSISIDKVLGTQLGLKDFILALSAILSEARRETPNMLIDIHKERDGNSSECVDKVTLLENKVDRQEPENDRSFSACILASHSSSNPEVDGVTELDIELKSTLQRCSVKEFEELKLEKERMQLDLTTCTEMLEFTKHQLSEAEQHLGELKSQLETSEKSNSLAEIQLKCMTESYKSLESRMQELQTEINLLHMKAEMLDNELQEERQSHQDDVAKYKEELQEHIERNEKLTMCAFPPDADFDPKTKQEKEIAAAAEKLAECQETIHLLGRQLQALHHPAKPTSLAPKTDVSLGDEPRSSFSAIQSTDQVENLSDSQLSPSEAESGHFPRSPVSSKRQKHRSSGSSSSSSSSSNTLHEKHGRGFSRFFSKGKSDH